MVVMSIIYPCNFGCPNCPYTDGNSEIRTFYRERNGDLFSVPLWQKIATEAGPYQAWLRCTGGGEPPSPLCFGGGLLLSQPHTRTLRIAIATFRMGGA